MNEPRISVVVPSHDRPLRLRWLLNALAAQTLPRGEWEVIVAHDSRDRETAELLAAHALAGDGTLRAIGFAPGSAGPAVKRNAAWRTARADWVLFTDDDCRPPADWLDRAVTAVAKNPGAIVQGATRPDPDEIELTWGAPHSRTQEIDPPTVWAEACNIAYPRALLERLGGFAESLPVASGEDTDLALRARRDGAEVVGAPELQTWHAVEVMGLAGRVRSLWRWQHLAFLVRRHPELRSELTLGVFWAPEHALLPLALTGLALARRRPAAALLALPWARRSLPSYGATPRGRLRAVSELPAQAIVQGAEMAALARGSVRYRTLAL